MATHGDAVATASVGGATWAVVADGVDARRWAGGLRLDEGPTAGGEVPLLRGHSAEQPAGREQRHSAASWPNPAPGWSKESPAFPTSVQLQLAQAVCPHPDPSPSGVSVQLTKNSPPTPHKLTLE